MSNQPEAIYLYDAPDVIGLDIDAVAQLLMELLPGTAVEARTDFFTFHLARFEPSQVEVLTEQLVARLHEREVRNLVAPDRRAEFDEVTPQERDLGVIYLASQLQDVMAPLIAEQERAAAYLHLVYIDQCIGSYVPGEIMLILQAIQHGQPTIISTTGMVEAPALPREYSFRRAQLVAFGMDEATAELDEAFADRTLGHEDRRITRAAGGFALQALFHHMFGEQNCQEANCPLRQATTHDELAAAHLGDGSCLCSRHALMLREAVQG